MRLSAFPTFPTTHKAKDLEDTLDVYLTNTGKAKIESFEYSKAHDQQH